MTDFWSTLHRPFYTGLIVQSPVVRPHRLCSANLRKHPQLGHMDFRCADNSVVLFPYSSGTRYSSMYESSNFSYVLQGRVGVVCIRAMPARQNRAGPVISMWIERLRIKLASCEPSLLRYTTVVASLRQAYAWYMYAYKSKYKRGIYQACTCALTIVPRTVKVTTHTVLLYRLYSLHTKHLDTYCWAQSRNVRTAWNNFAKQTRSR